MDWIVMFLAGAPLLLAALLVLLRSRRRRLVSALTEAALQREAEDARDRELLEFCRTLVCAIPPRALRLLNLWPPDSGDYRGFRAGERDDIFLLRFHEGAGRQLFQKIRDRGFHYGQVSAAQRRLALMRLAGYLKPGSRAAVEGAARDADDEVIENKES